MSADVEVIFLDNTILCRLVRAGRVVESAYTLDKSVYASVTRMLEDKGYKSHQLRFLDLKTNSTSYGLKYYDVDEETINEIRRLIRKAF